MTYCMPVWLQHGLKMGYFIYLQGLSQIALLMRVIKHCHISPAPIFSSVNSPNYFHLLPKLFLNFIIPRFRRNSNGLCITSNNQHVRDGWESWSALSEASTALTSMLVEVNHPCPCPGHHATGLLLETWTLGNVGINSRSLYDYSTCPFSCKTTTLERKKENKKKDVYCSKYTPH